MKAMVSAAVQAFAEKMRVEFLAETKDKAHLDAVFALAKEPDYCQQDREDYYNATRDVIDKYEEKRKKRGF